MIALELLQAIHVLELVQADGPSVDFVVPAAPVLEISDVGLAGRDGVPAELTTDLLAHYRLAKS